MKYQNKFTVAAVMEYTGNTSTPYSYNGVEYNTGDAVECAIIVSRGLMWTKDHFSAASVRQDLFDAERGYNTAIKSPRATLASPSLLGDAPDDKAQAVAVFMGKCRADSFIWAHFVNSGKSVECFEMSREQFREFVLSECWKVNSGKVRQLYGEQKTVKWLES